MNANTGSTYNKYKGSSGRFGKGTTNSNGVYLLEFVKKYGLILTNTLFYQKPYHRTTCTDPYRECRDSKSGNIHNNKKPYRNQTDYILVKQKTNVNVTDARSYGSTYTKLTIKWKVSKHNSKKRIGINMEQKSKSRFLTPENPEEQAKCACSLRSWIVNYNLCQSFVGLSNKLSQS